MACAAAAVAAAVAATALDLTVGVSNLTSIESAYVRVKKNRRVIRLSGGKHGRKTREQ